MFMPHKMLFGETFHLNCSNIIIYYINFHFHKWTLNLFAFGGAEYALEQGLSNSETR